MEDYTGLVKSLRWLSYMFSETHPAKDDTDRISNNIHLYCKSAADAIEELQKMVEQYKVYLQDAINDLHSAHEKEPKWIPVTERLPECDLGAEVGNIEWISCGMVHSGCFGRGGKYRDTYFRTWTDAGEGMDAKDADYWRAVTLPEPPKDESLDNSEPETKKEYYHAFCSRCGRPVIAKKEEAFWWPGGTTDDHLCIS